MRWTPLSGTGPLLLVVGVAALAYGCEPDLDSLSRFEGVDRGGTAGETNEAGSSGTSGGSDGVGGSDGTAGEANGGSGPPPPPACSNGVRGSNESDVDCGGKSDCRRCDVDESCTTHTDCDTNFCLAKKCAVPTCLDAVQNQDETDVDCGGSCSPDATCPVGYACLTNEDCASAYCSRGVCKDHCRSGKREADETDVDCGGAECGACADDQACLMGTDCESGTCSNNKCAAASCTDTLLNQDESDVDCGGSCTPCGLTRACTVAADCESYVCSDDECVADVTIPAEQVIDDVEDGNLVLPDTGGRKGTWYFFSDNTADATWSFLASAIPKKRGPGSAYGIHTLGSGFMTWGSGIGFDFNNPIGSATTKEIYDASNYVGVTFWARAAQSNTLIGVVFPDANTTQIAKDNYCTKCDHHWLTGVSLDTEWKRYTIEFKDLQLEGGGEPLPDPKELKTTGLIGIQFRSAKDTTYDFWIDDIAFITGTER